MAVKCKNIYILQDNYSASGVLLYNGRLNFTKYQNIHAKCEEIGNVKTNYVWRMFVISYIIIGMGRCYDAFVRSTLTTFKQNVT